MRKANKILSIFISLIMFISYNSTTINVFAEKNYSEINYNGNFDINDKGFKDFLKTQGMPIAGENGFIDEDVKDIPVVKENGFIKPVEDMILKDNVTSESLISLSSTDENSGFIKTVKNMPSVGENGFIAPISAPDPEAIVITTPEELANIETGKSYILGNDIDLSTYNNGSWTPINNCPSVLDGQGHKIINTNFSNLEYAGLFGQTDDLLLIKNIGIEINNISSYKASGGLIVNCKSAEITNCYVISENISANVIDGSAGGLIGFAESVKINNCYSTGEIGARHCGGLIGRSTLAEITNCFNNGDIEQGIFGGGLIGYSTSVKINNSYNTGTTIGGGLIGYCESAEVSNCYNNGNSKGKSGGLIDTNAKEVIIKNSYNIGNDFSGGLIKSVGDGANVTIESCYNKGTVTVGGLIANSEKGTVKINNSYNAGNIEGSSVGGLIGSIKSAEINNSYNIGNIKGEAAGGLIYSATSVKINNSYNKGNIDGNLYGGGLISSISDGTNMIENSYNTGTITGISGIGGLIRYNGSDNLTINNCYNSGKINTTIKNEESEFEGGGLVGYNPGTLTIKNSYNNGDITIDSQNKCESAYIGGLIGRTYKSTIKNSYNNGTINISNPYIKKNCNLGGLIGSSFELEIENSYNMGTFKLYFSNEFRDTYIGGLIGIGHEAVTVKNSYNISDISVNANSDTHTGGIVGYTETDVMLEDCYNLGEVKVSSESKDLNAGGLIGYNRKSRNEENISRKIKSCYNIGSITCSSKSGDSNIGGLIGYVHDNIIIESSYNMGNVKGTLENANIYAGGLIGYNWTKELAIIDCYNTGDINGTTSVTSSKRTRVGGLVGHESSTLAKIENSYNSGTIMSTGWYNTVGGLIGENSSEIIVENCYNIGSVTGYNGIGYIKSGGLIGAVDIQTTIKNSYNTGTIKSYFDVKDKTISPTAGGLVGTGAKGTNGKLTLEKCHNTGAVSSVNRINEYVYSGGLIGASDSNKVTDIHSCINFSLAISANIPKDSEYQYVPAEFIGTGDCDIYGTCYGRKTEEYICGARVIFNEEEGKDNEKIYLGKYNYVAGGYGTIGGQVSTDNQGNSIWFDKEETPVHGIDSIESVTGHVVISSSNISTDDISWSISDSSVAVIEGVSYAGTGNKKSFNVRVKGVSFGTCTIEGKFGGVSASHTISVIVSTEPEYEILVLDKETNSPIPNASLSVGTVSKTTNDSGIAVFRKSECDKNASLICEAENYRKYTSYFGAQTIRLQKKLPGEIYFSSIKISGESLKTKELINMSDSVCINPQKNKTCELNAYVDWQNEAVGSISLIVKKDNKDVENYTFNGNSLSMSFDNNDFRDADFYISATSADKSKNVIEKIPIVIVDMVDINIEMPGDSCSFVVDRLEILSKLFDDFSFDTKGLIGKIDENGIHFGKNAVDFDEDTDIPIVLDAGYDGGKFFAKGGIEKDMKILGKEASAGLYVNFDVNPLKEPDDDYEGILLNNRYVEANGNIECEISRDKNLKKEQINGLDDDNGIVLYDNNLNTSLGGCPVTFSIVLEGAMNAAVGICSKALLKNNSGVDNSYSGSIGTDITIKLFGGVGYDYDDFVCKVGAEGSLTGSPKIVLENIENIIEDKKEPNFALEFGLEGKIDAAAEFKAFLLEETGNFNLLTATVEGLVYNINKNELETEKPKPKLSFSGFIAELFGFDTSIELSSADNNNLKVKSRDYLKDGGGFVGNKITLADTSSGTDDTLIYENIYSTSNGQLQNIDGKDVLIFLTDDTSRNEMNALKLVYTIKNDGIWSEPQSVYDDGTIDSSQNFDGKFVVWENSKNVLTDVPKSINDIISKSDICLSVFDGESFVEPIKLTDNDFADMSPKVSAVDNKALIAWISNDENDFTALTGNTSINYCFYDCETGLTDIVKKENVGSVGRLVLDYDGTNANIYYKSNGKIYKINAQNGETEEIPVKDGFIQFAYKNNTMVTFYEDGSIIVNKDGSEEKLNSMAKLANGAPMIANEGENTYIYWIEEENDYSALKGINYTNDYGWSEKMDIISGEFNVSVPSIMVRDNGSIAITYLREEKMIRDENGNIRFGKANLHSVDIVDGFGAGIQNNSLNYYDNTGTIKFIVENTGLKPINNVEINIYEDSQIKETKTLSDTLKAGESKEYEISHKVEFNGSPIQLMVEAAPVDGNGKSSYDSILIGNADLYSDEISTFNRDGKYYIVSKIKNEGNVKSSESFVSVYKDSSSGTMLVQKKVPVMEAGDFEYIEFELPRPDFSNSEFLEYYVVISGDDEYEATYNNSSLAILRNIDRENGIYKNSGSCGNSVNWVVLDGVLTISGKGEMDDFKEEENPWKDSKDSVTSIIIDSGVTKIGNNAFYTFSQLADVTISGTVAAIGNNAFYGCDNLQRIIYYGLEKKWKEIIGENNFSDNIEIIFSLEHFYGDSDFDGIITVNDAALILDKVLDSNHKIDIEDNVSNYKEYIDVDDNEILTAADAAIVLEKALNSNFVMPVEIKK